MCGIAGVVAWDERYRTSGEVLARMSAAVAHRGPDDEDLWFNHFDRTIAPDSPQAAFAFRRLAVLDPGERSMQPFRADGMTLVFNGEIYNYRELRAELSALRPQHEWRSDGDAEVLLLAYATWREKCLPKLNGMFALAIWDEADHSLFVARDPLGQKPLYLTGASAGTATVIAFASELPALRRLPWFDSTIHKPSLETYLRYGYVEGSAGLTIYASVAQLAPRTATLYRHGRPVWSERYFDPNAFDDGAPPPTPARTRELVARAVRRQLVTDVPLGVFLSGGVDSSVIAACAAAAGPTDTFSIGFDDPRYDETEHAAAVARHVGSTHHAFAVTPAAAADLPALAAAFGEPFGDSSALPTHYLARETRQHVTVALSGDGGDELFGGYPRYGAMKLGATFEKLPRALRRVLALGVAGGGASHPKSTASNVRRFLATIDRTAGRRYASYLRLFSPGVVASLLRQTAPDPDYVDYVEGAFEAFTGERDAVQAALALDRVAYLPDDLLTKVDRASMRHALEVRSPFLDPDLVTYAAGLSTQDLLGGGPKRMLREAFAGQLPAWVFKRKKMGFAVPVGEWFRTDAALKAMLNDTLFARDAFAASHFDVTVVRKLVDSHATARADHGQRLYALLMLELWWRSTR